MTDTTTTKDTDETISPDDLAEFRAFQAGKEKADTDETPRRWFVLDDNFVFPNTSQGDIRIRLTFKFKLIRAIRAKDLDELDQLIALLDGIGDTATLAQLDELEAFGDIPQIVDGFFTAVQEKNEASVGEASRSSI